MKKFYFICLMILFFQGAVYSETITIPKGTFIRVYPNDIISSGLNQTGDRVYFVNPSDMWIGEENVFPKNTLFTGYIDMVRLPVQGVNGAFSIKIDGIVLPDRQEMPFQATVTHNGSRQVGGENTPPSSYTYAIRKVPPYGWFGGIPGGLQYVPSGEYEFGQHATVDSKDAFFITLDEDFVYKTK